MCRLIALPPGTPSETAHELVSHFVRGNDDGVGEAFVVKGDFKINKYPYSYHEAVTKKDALFKHMPYDGWTIAHVRLATHGEHTWVNTHPFIKGDVAVVHNGVFGAHSIIKAALGGSVKWSGDCDSEVAAYLLSKLGPDKFFQEMPKFSSVYLGLNRDGSLDAVKLGSGDLKIYRRENDTFILASEFPFSKPWYDSRECAEGVLSLDKDGHATNFKFENRESRRERYEGYYSSRYTGRGGYNNTVEELVDSMITNTPSTESTAVLLPFRKQKKLDLWDWPTEEEWSKIEQEDMK